MASLKEVKTRIASVNNTRKITSAMKMVASSKLHRAQQSIENMRPYQSRLERMTTTFVAHLEGDVSSPYAVQREVKRVAIVVYSSNSSLCGAFNANIIKVFNKKVEEYRTQGIEVVAVYPLGRKAADAARKAGFSNCPDYTALLDHPAYEPASRIAAELMQKFEASEVDKIDLIFHHFKSIAKQEVTEEVFLPVSLDFTIKQTEKEDAAPATGYRDNYIVEPSVEEVLERLIPKSLHLKLYTALLDSLASEHASRVVAMQVATDNADELLCQLKLTYNKTRQQAITAELLDIVGGSMQ